MLFHSLDYILFLFLAVTLFWALSRKDTLRILVLFLMSCRFYMVWNPVYIFLVISSALIDYSAGRMIPLARTERGRKAWLILSIVTNLGVLITFKYYNFFYSVVQDSLGLFGISVPAAYLKVLLPVGISFYTFQSMCYTIDVFQKKLEPVKNFLHFATFTVFFPSLVAGPITKAQQLIPQLQARPRLTAELVGNGTFLIVKGLVKKIVFADFLALNLVDRVFDNPQAFTSVETLIGLYGYTLQIYCDFSGYTDVARGSAMLLGIELPENFNRPYMATSPAQFWRRWHMTLSSWLRNYVYYPLGGSHCSTARTYWNLWLTLFLIGIWHGAGWTFVVYGTIHGLAMVVHRYFYKKSGRTKTTVDPRWLEIIKIFVTFHFVVLSRILFRSPDLGVAGDVASQLFAGSLSTAQVTWRTWLVLGVGFGIHWTPKSWVDAVQARYRALPAPVQGLVLAGVAAVLFKLGSSQVVPYIYFQF
ncbi:MAG TPA: MBOAT family O-acyltransferase [Myxococcota bacterium]|mgnify:FL=1|nr:MBOAT family O-acyltransferase [Myxococcota bacterium]HOA12405.1 MBOAT family O-acyltransferase [Myxococcota bacterium]HOC99663.1 MBOAT family O-acyltransferase [Myxococcota bacterium]HOH75710.1 MBOAT family O-acyltransferase [Myxococcota bacterium]